MIDTGLDLAVVETATTGADPRTVLLTACHLDRLRRAAHTGVLITALAWADGHAPEEPWQAATIAGVPMNADDVPTVAMTAVAELAALLGQTTIAGAHLIGDALELRHRLPRTWALLRAGTIEVHRARQVAGLTRTLTAATAAEADAQFAAVGGLVGPAHTERIVAAAIARHEPERAAELARRAEEARGVWFEEDRIPGLTAVSGRLDHGDAAALDDVLDAAAHELAGELADRTHQSLRARALGDLARGQAPLPTGSDAPDDAGRGDGGRHARPARHYTVHLHLSDHALGSDGDTHPWARVDGITSPVPAQLIRTWLGDPTARITVRPVVDLNDDVQVDAYEIPTGIRDRVLAREPRCVFPWCDKPSTATGIDLDHITAHADGGPTATSNLAPLCRTHHRLKTHGRWTYRRDITTGGYWWQSPHGYTIVTGPWGTEILTPPPTQPYVVIPHPADTGPPSRPPRRPPKRARQQLSRWLRGDKPPPKPAAAEAPPF